MPIFLVNSALPSDRNSTFSLPPDFSSQAASTNGSFTAMHVTRSTPCFLVVGALDEARQMLEMAGRGEGTRHGEQNDTLAGEHVLGGQDLESVGSCDPEGRLGQAVSNFNRHAVLPERLAVARGTISARPGKAKRATAPSRWSRSNPHQRRGPA